MRFISLTTLMLAGAAAAAPTVTNQDRVSYTLHLECAHVSASDSTGPGETVTLRSFAVGKNCRLDIYSQPPPYDREGNFDTKKRLGSSKVKKDTECVISKGQLACE